MTDEEAYDQDSWTFEQDSWEQSRDLRMCICTHFEPGPGYEAKPPYDPSCYFHGERQGT